MMIVGWQHPRYYSPVVQSVERRTVNPYVPGSSPGGGVATSTCRLNKNAVANCRCQIPLLVGNVRLEEVKRKNIGKVLSTYHNYR